MRISDWSSDVCSSDLSVQGSRCDRRAVAARCLLRAADGCERARCALCRLAGCGIAGAQRPLTLQQRRSEHIDAEAGDAERREAVDPVEQTWVDAVAQFADETEEHTSALQSLMRISYAVFCLKTTNKQISKH